MTGKDDGSREPVIIQCLGDPHLLEAAERMLVESVLRWGAWDRLEVQHHEDCITTRSPIDFPFFNNVMDPRLTPESAPDRIGELLDFVGECRRGVCWWLGRDSSPPSLPELLEAAGAFMAMENRIMAVELQDLPPASIPEGVEIVEIMDEEQLARWTSVVAQAHGIPDEFRPFWTGVYSAAGYGPGDGTTRHFLALMDGRPVGATTLITAAGVASVANVATDSGYRHRGIGSALTLWPLKMAREAGYRVACLSASSQGEPVYARLGFRGYHKNAVYLWMPAGPAK